MTGVQLVLDIDGKVKLTSNTQTVLHGQSWGTVDYCLHHFANNCRYVTLTDYYHCAMSVLVGFIANDWYVGPIGFEKLYVPSPEGMSEAWSLEKIIYGDNFTLMPRYTGSFKMYIQSSSVILKLDLSYNLFIWKNIWYIFLNHDTLGDIHLP